MMSQPDTVEKKKQNTNSAARSETDKQGSNQ